jgi:hypothetical protein
MRTLIAIILGRKSRNLPETHRESRSLREPAMRPQPAGGGRDQGELRRNRRRMKRKKWGILRSVKEPQHGRFAL